MARGGDQFGSMVPLWWVLGCLWDSFGMFFWATLGTQKATREALRRVTGLFGGPKGFWKGPGLILGVVWGSKKAHFDVPKLEDSIDRANEIFIFRVLDTGPEKD